MTAAETKDENEKKQIEYALLRNWSVDDENVQVKVSANKVTLKGVVHSLFQRNEIERIQALRVIRRAIRLGFNRCEPAIARALIAVPGALPDDKDRMMRACLAALCELGKIALLYRF